MALYPVTLSRREDIVASKKRFNYLVDSIRKGSITAKSLYGENEVSLLSDEIAGLSFWTKSPGNFIEENCLCYSPRWMGEWISRI